MPAFTFEKISPPPRRGAAPGQAPAPDTDKKQRGVIVQILDRFVEARVKRAVPKDGLLTRRGKRPS